MISIAIACALIIYLFGYLDSPNYHGIAWAAKMICHQADQQPTHFYSCFAPSHAILIGTFICSRTLLPCVTCLVWQRVWTRWCSVKLKSPAKSKTPTRSRATPD